MSNEGLFRENIRRIEILLAELGNAVESRQISQGACTITFRQADLLLQARVEQDHRFVEFAAQFHFEKVLSEFLTARVDDLQQVCYHYGCYQLLVIECDEIVLSVHTKLYFSGLQYYALKEALDDLANAVKELRHLFEPAIGPVGG